MNEKEFNLLDEPWIRVIDNKCNISEVSLKEAIVNSHKYVSLSGELPTQDVAVMRLMLAVLHTVYSRVDEDGSDVPLEDDEEMAIERWEALWEKGYFSEKAVTEYLDKWHERFWLFHPERPFGQLAGLDIGTEYDAPKLNGELSESGNKVRLFSMYSGDEKSRLSYAQAARWLLYVNAYDDTSSKPTKEGKAKAGGSLPSPGIGWLGKLGIVFLKGNNLFETLLLNMVMINENVVQYEQKPVWEREKICGDERRRITMPGNLAELYTIQSRRILLNRESDAVTSYRLLGGDFFEKENAFAEPMTVWRKPQKDNEPFTPRRHDSTRQMWREFATLYNYEKWSPGVVKWCRELAASSTGFKKRFVKTAVVSVEYGDKDFFVKNVFDDSLSLHAELIGELGKNMHSKIEAEIKKCDQLASATAYLAENLHIASGGSDNDNADVRDKAKSELFYCLDIPFRQWLYSIDPENCDEQEVIAEWQKKAQHIAYKYKDELVSQSSDAAIIGHMIRKNDGKSNKLYSVPMAENIFYSQVAKIYPKQ